MGAVERTKGERTPDSWPDLVYADEMFMREFKIKEGSDKT